MVLPELAATLDIQKSSNQGAVRINPEVWTSYDSISAVLPKPAGSYSRADLKKLVSHAFSENDHHLISELFVKTMTWGSGQIFNVRRYLRSRCSECRLECSSS